MVAALTASALFLICYVAYHYVHGDTKYTGEYRAVYLPLLASHVILSMPVLPLALTAVWFAITKRFALHKKVTRIALPIWLYVSVTGVLVYFFLR
jgi:putative membrane protein